MQRIVVGLVGLWLAAVSMAQAPPQRQPVLVHPIRQVSVGLVFDSRERKVVEVDDEGRVWRMDAAGWSMAPGSAEQPAPRGSGMLVYDDLGRRLWRAHGDGTLWTFEQGRWSQFADGGVRPAAIAQVTYDGAGGRLLAMGAGAIWEFDGQRWRVLGAYLPSVHVGEMCFDEFRGVLVLVDRSTGGVCEWDGRQWSIFAVTFPSTWTTDLSFAPVVYNSVQHRVVVAGACHQNSFWVAAEWDGVQWVSRLGSYSGNGWSFLRCWCSAWFDRATGLLMFLGGTESMSTLEPILQISSWDGLQIRDVAELSAPCQVSYWFHDLRTNQDVVVETNYCLLSCPANTWLLDARHSTWSRVPALAPRGRLPCAFDTIRNEGLVWEPGQLHAFTGGLWVPRGAQGPTYGADASMAFDPLRGELVLRGDATSLWLWNGATWTQRATPFGPTARSRAAMAFDPVAGQCVLFGGRNPGGTWRNDTWTWDGTQWVQAVGSAPPVLTEPSLQFDPVQQRMVLLGQRQGSEWWRRDSTGWTFVDRSRVPCHSLLWDDARGNFAMLCAGANGGSEAIVEWTPVPAMTKVFGSGCTPTTPALELLARPRLGDARFGLRVAASPGTLVGFEVGTARTSAARSPCAPRIAGSLGQAIVVADARGMATLALPLPLLPALQGLDAFAQAAVQSPGASHPEFTHGVWLLLGD